MKYFKKFLSIILSLLTIISAISVAMPIFAGALTIDAPFTYYENGIAYIKDSTILSENDFFECKLGENGTWTVCNDIFSVVATEPIIAYIRCANTSGEKGTISTVSIPRTIGLFEESFIDIETSENALIFEFARTYNSDTGWFFSFESNISEYNEKTYRVTDFYGKDEYYYLTETDEKYETLSGKTLELIKNEEDVLSGYCIYFDDFVYRYDATGRLQFTQHLTNITTFTWADSTLIIKDVAGNAYTVYFDSSGNPISITTPVYTYTDNSGNVVTQNRNVSYLWNANNLIAFVDSNGIGHSYGYSNNKLSSYDYYSISYTNDGRLLSKTYIDGSFTKYSYYDAYANSNENQTYQIGAMTVTESNGESYSYRYNGESLDNPIVEISDTYSFVGFILNLDNEELLLESKPLYEDTGENYIFYRYDSETEKLTEEITVNYKDVTNVEEMTFEEALAVAETKNEYVYDSNGRETTKLIYSKKNGILTLTNRELRTYYDDGRVKWYYYDKNGGSYWWSLKRYYYTYDIFGNIKTEYSYNPYDVLEIETNTTNTYNVFGELISSNITGDIYTQSSIALEYTYDVKGRLIRETEQTRTSYTGYYDYISGVTDGSYTKNSENIYVYNDAGNITLENFDGKVTVYQYNNLMKLSRKYNPDGSFVDYTYDEYGNLLTKTLGDYVAEYSALGELTKATKNGIVIFEKNITNNTETYANGQSVSYVYDNNERLQTVKCGNETIYSYAYPETTDEDGNITDEWTEVTDNQSQRKTVYKDDITSVYDISSTIPVLLYRVESEKEEVGVASSFNGIVETLGDVTYTTKYEDGCTTFLTSSGKSFSRVVEEMPNTYYQFTNIRTANNYYEQYTIDSNDQLTVVETVFNGGNRKYANVYDLDGRITKINQASGTVWTANDFIEYVYDDNDQLIRVNDPYNSFTRTYSYDSRGNITERKEYAYTTGSLDGVAATDTASYTYANTAWNDELTVYDGQSISYDAAGNPVSYMGHNLIWNFGRRLASFDGITFTYNEDGIRTSKTVNGVKTNFYLDGTRIIHQTDGTNTFHFRYDSDGSPIGFEYNGSDYFYVKNLQGDIMGILDNTYALVAEYSYDEWGKVISVTGINTALGNLNPLRYRSYYYDSETGLYYLQSRYYDPEIGRFINADDVNYVGLFDTNVSFNAFVYCENNPINNIDPLGFIKINIAWVDIAVDILIIVIPMIGKINAVLKKAGKAYSSIIYTVNQAFTKYYGKITSAVTNALKKYFNATIARQITAIVGSGLFKVLSIVTIFSSVGNIIEYIIDCLDGKRDGYLDTSAKLKFRIVW